MMVVLLLTLMMFPIYKQGAILHTILNSGLLSNLDLFFGWCLLSTMAAVASEGEHLFESLDEQTFTSQLVSLSFKNNKKPSLFRVDRGLNPTQLYRDYDAK